MKSKNLVIATVLFASVVASARTNFNTLIVENANAQNELHAQIKSTVEDVKMAVNEGAKAVQIASDTVHVKTSKELLTFAKEKKSFSASDKKADKRLAEEFQNLE